MEDNKKFVWCVNAYYDMNIDKDEEIIHEVYATEQLAQKRVRELIRNFKRDDMSYADTWDEGKYRLYAYMDSEWNVDISYTKQEVIQEQQTNQKEDDMTITLNFHIYEGVDGNTWFVERYQDKNSVPLWRYGYRLTEDEPWRTIKDGLRSKPNLKRMGLIK